MQGLRPVPSLAAQTCGTVFYREGQGDLCCSCNLCEDYAKLWCGQLVDGPGPSLPPKDPTAREGGGQRPSDWLAEL